MLEFIQTHPTESAIAGVIIVAILVLLFINRKDVMAKSALYIVAKAESEFGSQTGQIKFAEAYSYLRRKYPLITLLLPKSTLTKIIEEALKSLKGILKEKAKDNAGLIEEEARKKDED